MRMYKSFNYFVAKIKIIYVIRSTYHKRNIPSRITHMCGYPRVHLRFQNFGRCRDFISFCNIFFRFKQTSKVYSEIKDQKENKKNKK